ncbi:hypothetical protein K488DRAFT_40853 [Vararia minispora EC-137]|uniref:Uncharacterized protein n=1 Tax=Vararia minispora EC-137 TaxID=1314806 RepID=A0ACB8QXM3_9AGAM|nr:hypothetical protein K488DRAFT_40853 [Vararia minispora EC-137]
MAGAPWNDARDVLGEVAEMAKDFNADGLDIYFLNDDHTRLDARDKHSVDTVFKVVRPSGQTPTGSRLQDLFNIYVPHLDPRRSKPIVFVVITDGAPTDDPEAIIVSTARRLEERNIPLRMVGVQFIQIGDDPGATAALKKLDDGLARIYGIRVR